MIFVPSHSIKSLSQLFLHDAHFIYKETETAVKLFFMLSGFTFIHK